MEMVEGDLDDFLVKDNTDKVEDNPEDGNFGQ